MTPSRLANSLGRLEGIGLMIGAGICFGVMGILIKYSGRLPVFELVFLRGIFGLIPLVLLLWRRGRRPRFCSIPFLLLRSLSGIGGMSCYFYAVVHLDLATASVLNKSSPVFVVLFAWILLRERVGRRVIPFVLLALAGCGLLIRPDLTNATSNPLAGFVGAGSAILSAIAYTTLRHLRQTDEPLDIVFFFMTSTVVLCCPGLLYQFTLPEPSEWLAMAGAGWTAATGQVLMTRSYRIEKASIVSPFLYVSVLCAALGGYLLWEEVLTTWSALGSVLIIAGGIGVSMLRSSDRSTLVS